MTLVINHNLIAANAARNLSAIYKRLSESTTRLSSGLRINSADDDPAALAVREMMRADIAALSQGQRNAADAVSLVQTAEGALQVIDEKLIRMKELAEQASTGTYTTAQRLIMNSEYQEMAAEIDRIANETSFNNLHLLNGDLEYLNRGSGLKVHFGAGNDPDEDYYFIGFEDVRATSQSGLRIGGDGDNDIWGQAGATADGEAFCCGVGGIDSLTEAITGVSGKTFSYAYNYDQNRDLDPNGSGLSGKFSYLAGMYRAESGDSLQDLINDVNAGAQSRIKVDFASANSAGAWNLGSGAVNICLGNEVYQFIEGGTASGYDSSKDVFKVLDTTIIAASALTQAINASSVSFWAYAKDGDVFVFHKQGGDYDYLTGSDEGLGASGVAAASTYVNWQNMETYDTYSAGTTFGQGGESWGELTAQEVGPGWSVRLDGRDIGDRHDLQVQDVGSADGSDIDISGMGFDSGVETLSGFASSDFAELQDASDAPWPGAEIRTMSAAQAALDAVTRAISEKDRTLADLGAMHNRLENTITHLSAQVDNLQAAESKISDVDMAREVTAFTRNNILAQAAVSMVAQANVLPSLALSLLK